MARMVAQTAAIAAQTRYLRIFIIHLCVLPH
jgi:hypothetical protein